MSNKTCEKCKKDPYKFDRAEYNGLSEKYLCSYCENELMNQYYDLKDNLVKDFFADKIKTEDKTNT